MPMARDMEPDRELLDSVKLVTDLPFEACRYALQTPASEPAVYVYKPAINWRELWWQ